DKFTVANKLMPENIEALTGLTKAQQLRDLAVQKAQEAERLKSFQHLVDEGKAHLAKNQPQAAVVSLTAALKIYPANPDALKLLDQAQKALVGADQALAKAKKDAEDYQKAMNEGRHFLQVKQYDAAIKSFEAAQGLLKGDKTSLALLQEAQQGKANAKAAADK